jgi:hypothetical protein
MTGITRITSNRTLCPNKKWWQQETTKRVISREQRKGISCVTQNEGQGGAISDPAHVLFFDNQIMITS